MVVFEKQANFTYTAQPTFITEKFKFNPLVGVRIQEYILQQGNYVQSHFNRS